MLEDLQNSEVKLGDFGFSKRLSAGQKLNEMCGSPLYMAPEVLYGEAYDIKADIWSFGVTIY